MCAALLPTTRYGRARVSVIRRLVTWFRFPGRFCRLAGLFLLLSTCLMLFHSSEIRIRRRRFPATQPSSPSWSPEIEAELFDTLSSATSAEPHPIDDLIAGARRKHGEVLRQRSTDLQSAVARYRDRRGRHPPPGFDKWVNYALKHDAVMVENFFDRIYHDLQPFWALDAKDIAIGAAAGEYLVRVRNRTATPLGHVEGRVPWLQLWTDLVAECADSLPDVDLPINYLDESRILVPWEHVNELVGKASATRKSTPAEDVIAAYQGLDWLDQEAPKAHKPSWITDDQSRYWDLMRVTCPPDSPSRNVNALSDFSMPPVFPNDWNPDFSENGYVRNFTAAMDPCNQPHLRSLHGTFVEPVSLSTTRELLPLFGGSKLLVNNDILIPGAMYLTNDAFYSGGSDHGPAWKHKSTSVSWRGVASGGRHRATNWMHFQRLRLVQMLNATTLNNMEDSGATRAMTFEMPPSLHLYDFPHRRTGSVGRWLQDWVDVGLVELLCFPRDSNCSYLQPYFHEVEAKPLSEQFSNKFMPDVDGNSFSARYRSLLLSTSLPIKATLYAEWHDDRLQPWLHFAPMDNTFQDLYGILHYFTRDEKGDAAANLIAELGKRWAETVLRRQDMLLYVWRLLLEFARLCDENRDRLGWVGDLVVQEK